MVVATRYAKSLLDLALDTGKLEQVYKDMQLIKSVSVSNDDFVNMLENPIIKTDKKQTILKKIFDGVIDELTMKFMMLMAEKRREGLLDDISKAFVEQYKKYKNITTAVVVSASGLDPQAREQLLAKIREAAPGEVDLHEHVDKSLIGGFKVKVGDRQIDATILRKLNDLRKSFSENPFVREF